MSKQFQIFYINDANDGAVFRTMIELESIPVGMTRVISGWPVTRWNDKSFEAGTWGKSRMGKESMAGALESSTNNS